MDAVFVHLGDACSTIDREKESKEGNLHYKNLNMTNKITNTRIKLQKKTTIMKDRRTVIIELETI
jgi:hypothetical protein